MQVNPSMAVYSTDWYGQQSFRMMPVTNSCPFNEVIFDPSTRVLAIISRDKKDKPHMVPKLNDKGQMIPLKTSGADAGQPRFVEERRIMETYYEYYMDNIDDIKSFINTFAINPTHPAITIIDTPSQTSAQ